MLATALLWNGVRPSLPLRCHLIVGVPNQPRQRVVILRHSALYRLLAMFLFFTSSIVLLVSQSLTVCRSVSLVGFFSLSFCFGVYVVPRTGHEDGSDES